MIKLPTQLVEAIRTNVSNSKPFSAVKLRENYQAFKNHEGMYDTYLMSRMPATYATFQEFCKKFT